MGFTVSKDLKERVQLAAYLRGLSVSSFILWACDQRADAILAGAADNPKRREEDPLPVPNTLTTPVCPPSQCSVISNAR